MLSTCRIAAESAPWSQWKDPATGTSLIVTAAHPDPPTLTNLTTSTASYATATATPPLFSDPKLANAVMNAVERALPVG